MTGPGPAPRVADVVAVLDRLYDPRWAQPWDAVGLVCGDPGAPVRRVLLAVDPVEQVVEEAVAWGADLLVTHHPLFLRGVHGIAATTPKGRVVHRLVTAGVALHTAHTNADVAAPGVSDALAAAIGLADLRPLVPEPPDATDKLVTFVPDADAGRVLDALAGAGAGRIGAYERCAWTAAGTGTFRPAPGARPAIGRVGDVEAVAETRLEVVLPRHRRAAVLGALVQAHPYEEPAYDVYELAALPGARGLGRLGTLPVAEPVDAFLSRVAAALPATAAGLRATGLRATGDPASAVRTVAVCGGAGDSLLAAAAAAGVDAFVTADLRHHPVSEALADGSPLLVDVGHWASEWPWLAEAGARLRAGLADTGAGAGPAGTGPAEIGPGDRGTTVEVRVSTLVTDPWTAHRPTGPRPGSAS